MTHTLYAELELKKNASGKEVKESFHRLARKHHPDKGGSADRFKRIQYAYSILSDVQKRNFYDSTGDDGLEMMNMFEGGDTGHGSSSGIRCSGVCILILFFTFAGLRLNHTVDVPWAVVFIPLWVIDLFILCITAALVRVSNAPAFVTRLMGLGLCFVLFTFLLCLGLSEVVTCWTLVFSPVLLYTLFPLARGRWFDSGLLRGILELGSACTFPVFVLLLSLRMDGYNDNSWWTVTAPLFVDIMFATVANMLTVASNLRRCSSQGDELLYGNPIHMCCEIFGWNAVVAVCIALTAAHLEGTHVPVPLVITLAFVVLMLYAFNVCIRCACWTIIPSKMDFEGEGDVESQPLNPYQRPTPPHARSPAPPTTSSTTTAEAID